MRGPWAHCRLICILHTMLQVLSSQVVPASDVWAAGVMAYQLLSGGFPFDDRSNPEAPALSLVWRAIFTEEPRCSLHPHVPLHLWATTPCILA